MKSHEFQINKPVHGLRLSRTKAAQALRADNTTQIGTWAGGPVRKRKWFKVFPTVGKMWKGTSSGTGMVNGVEIASGETWVWVAQTISGHLMLGWTSNMPVRHQELCFRPSGVSRWGRVVWMKARKVEGETAVQDAYRLCYTLSRRWGLPAPKPPRGAPADTMQLPEPPQ